MYLYLNVCECVYVYMCVFTFVCVNVFVHICVLSAIKAWVISLI